MLDGRDCAAYNRPAMSDVDSLGLTLASHDPSEPELPPVAVLAAPEEPKAPEPEPAPEEKAESPAPVAEAAPEPIPEPQPERAPEPPVRRTRTAAPRREDRPGLVAATAIAIEDIEPDDTFQLREVGDVAGLATSMARMGQLFPIDVRRRGGSFQVIAGFRRLAAVRFLQRATILARVHEGMAESQAWAYALAQALESKGLSTEEITAIRERLERQGQLTTMARGLIDAALTVPGSDLEPEEPPRADAAEEVDLDELAADVHERLAGISGDLSLITDLWLQLDAPAREALLDQLRYYGELFGYLSRLR